LVENISGMASEKALNIVKGFGRPSNGDSVKSYANDPFVLEKLEKAKEFLSKHPIPDHLLKR
jgi:hypothetical protein